MKAITHPPIVTAGSGSLGSNHLGVVSLSTSSRRDRDYRLLRAGLLILDLIVLGSAVITAGLIWGVVEPLTPGSATQLGTRHIFASIAVAPALVILFRLHGLYDFDRILVGLYEYTQIVHAVTYGVMILFVISFFAGGTPLVSRSWLVLVWGLSIFGVAVGRFAIRRVVRRLRQHGVLRTRVVVVGASTYGVTIAQQLRAARHEGLDVVGFVDEYVPLGLRLLDDIAVVGRPSDLLLGMNVAQADEYVLVSQALPDQRFAELSRLMVGHDRPRVRLAVNSIDMLTNGLHVAERGSIPLVTLQRARIVGMDAVLKRGLDLMGAVLALTVMAPVVLVAVLRGLLRGIRPLTIRRCVVGVDDAPVPLLLLDRAVSTSLAVRGAPAFLAVLRGDVSLVGPRPVQWDPDHVSPSSAGLTAVKPGLTGPWRLSGATASLTDQAMQDLTYVRNFTVWEDARIIWKSILHTRPGVRLVELGRWEG